MILSLSMLQAISLSAAKTSETGSSVLYRNLVQHRIEKAVVELELAFRSR